MKKSENGFLLLIKNGELSNFEKISIEYDNYNVKEYKVKCLERYCDFLKNLGDIDIIHQFSDGRISNLRRNGYVRLKDETTFVYVNEQNFQTLFKDNLSEDEAINVLRKLVFEHTKISIDNIIKNFENRKDRPLNVDEWIIDDNIDNIMTQEEFNKMMIKFDEIKKIIELRQDPFIFKETSQSNDSLIEALENISNAINNLSSSTKNDDSKSQGSKNSFEGLTRLFEELKETDKKIKQRELEKAVKKEQIQLSPISTTVKDICQNVIGQDEAVKKSVLAVYNNLDLITKNLSASELVTLKNNILMSGKSGCGKTEIARQIAANFNIPVCIEDITQYTGAGWAGNDLNELLKRLYLISGRNIEVAQRGVLVLDEIDKISIDKSNDRRSHNTLEVQQGLLKLIEGGFVDLDMGQMQQKISFDTRFLTVIGTGAFNGYNRTDNLSSENKYFLKQDYINYGLMPEFVGRFKTFIKLNELSFEDKKRILLESKLSVLNLKLADLESRGIKVNIECTLDQLCESIIRKSEELSNGDCGVRDFNEIAFNMFSDIYYRLYDGENPTEITFNTGIVEDPKQAILRRK